MPCAASRACGTILVGRPMRMPVAGSTTTLQPYSASCALAAATRSARSDVVSTPVILALWRFWKFLIAASIGSSPPVERRSRPTITTRPGFSGARPAECRRARRVDGAAFAASGFGAAWCRPLRSWPVSLQGSLLRALWLRRALPPPASAMPALPVAATCGHFGILGRFAVCAPGLFGCGGSLCFGRFHGGRFVADGLLRLAWLRRGVLRHRDDAGRILRRRRSSAEQAARASPGTDRNASS